MSDVLNSAQRHYNMSQIRSKDTKPEEIVRKYLFNQGFRYRKNDARYPGKPDIVLPKFKTIVFVHGCFWHQHPGCKKARIPDTNTDFWTQKFERNVLRDKRNQELLKAAGWRVTVVWECEVATKKKRASRLPLLAEEIKQTAP
jgi:DNA mismatch endonuclease (patch repair protein)